MNERVGMFEAKTKFSELCARVSETGVPVTVTKRGEPLVVIGPAPKTAPSVLERLRAYRARYENEPEEPEFEVPPRTSEMSSFALED